jgi:hypothetical protein
MAGVSASISAAETVRGGGSGPRQGSRELAAQAEEAEVGLASAMPAVNVISPANMTASKAILRSLESSRLGSHHISGHALGMLGSTSSSAHGTLSREAIHPRIAERAMGVGRKQSYDERNNSSQQSEANQAEYVDDFKDSTKGTALISPPDPGTKSPLTWSPDFSFGFVDLSEQDFLKPSIHVEGISVSNGKAKGQQGRQGGRQQRRSQISPANKDPFAMPSPLQTLMPQTALQDQTGLRNSGLNSTGLNLPEHDYFSNLQR